MSHFTKIVAFLMIVLVFDSATAIPDCLSILGTIDPCIPYLMQNGPGVQESSPSQVCCDAIKTLSTSNNTKDECECIKASVLLTPMDTVLFSGLPGVCGVTSWKIPPISGDMDCSTL